MNLRDQAIAVLRQHGASYHFMNVDEAADAILALVRAHMTLDEAVEAGARAVEAAGACVPLKWLQDDVVYYRRFARAAIIAALGDTHD